VEDDTGKANDFPFQSLPISVPHFIKFCLRAKIAGFKEHIAGAFK
jgi:hypothetical protein